MHRAFVLLALGALPACAQNTSCSFAVPAIALPSLAYPIAGATGVPDDLNAIVYFGSGANTPIELGTGSQILKTVAEPVPSPLPSPIETPSFASPYYARSVPMLAANTTYAIRAYYSSPGGTGPCGSPPTSGYATFGTFTTQ